MQVPTIGAEFHALSSYINEQRPARAFKLVRHTHVNVMDACGIQRLTESSKLVGTSRNDAGAIFCFGVLVSNRFSLFSSTVWSVDVNSSRLRHTEATAVRARLALQRLVA